MRELLKALPPCDITGDEALRMVIVLREAYDRKYPGVADLTVRRKSRRRR